MSDTIKLSKNRSAEQQSQDAIMQLKNELSQSGALRMTDAGDGKTEVSITVLVEK